MATKAFIKYSDLPDKEYAVYQSSPVNDLILLIPDRIRINNSEIFQNSSCSPVAAKTRYQAFSHWVKSTRTKLLTWDVETQAFTKTHQAMIGNVTESGADLQVKELTQKWSS